MNTTPAYPKRLIEVDLPIKRISAHARREKSIRHGHISTLHIWWARRPLAACRAVILASLWPDPADPLCPPRFLEEAKKSLESTLGGQTTVNVPKRDYGNPLNVRAGLLDFIAEFANWDNSTNKDYLGFSRHLVQVAHESLGGAPGTRPLVVDPFAGGGSIPLEALRVGADAFASDLNPIPVLLNKVVLEYIPKYGQRLADEVRKWGEWIKREAEKELTEFYPKDPDGTRQTAYLWARTILSEEPAQGEVPIEVPLFRSPLISKRKGGISTLRWKRDKNYSIVVEDILKDFANGVSRIVRSPILEIVDLTSISDVESGTSHGGAATCPISQFTTSVEAVRRQLKTRSGGSADARLLCVIGANPDNSGRTYSLPSDREIKAARLAAQELNRRQGLHTDSIPLIPDGTINHLRGFFNVVLYGIERWGQLFSQRQLLSLTTFARLITEVGRGNSRGQEDLSIAVQTTLAMALGRMADYSSTLCMWAPSGEFVAHTFGRQALPMVWDYAEVNPLAPTGWSGACEWVIRVVEATASANLNHGEVGQSSAQKQSLPNDSADATITDPPYYAAIPYADLSDFFYPWLKRAIGSVQGEICKFESAPKEEECVSLSHRAAMYRHKDNLWFESTMTECCMESRRINKPSGIGVYVFANKETSGWEAMLGALIESGWIVTASWPIDTERGGRLRAINSAALASSVHLVCRPRENPDGSVRTDEIGNWRDVLQELPRRIHEWMPRLAEEGVVGADAIFACLGPALEIFSRYSRVEKASGEMVALKDYLVEVWAAVANEALSLIFKEADSGGLEPDARLTAMWLWTLSASGTEIGGSSTPDEEADEETSDADEVGTNGRPAKGEGFSLEFDAARKIAQGLGANLDDLRSVVEVKGKTARLLPVSERARHLLGKDEGRTAPAPKTSRGRAGFLKGMEDVKSPVPTSATWDEIGPTKLGATVLNRVHQAMLLFGTGRAEALKRFVVEEGAGTDARFWKLAQSLSALYPTGTNEKRWVDGVLARKKGLGF